MGTMGKACVRIPATLASCEVNIVKSQLAEAFCCDLYWWNDKLRLKLKLKLPGIWKHLSVMNCGYTCCCYAAPDIDVCQHVTSIQQIFHCSPGVLLDDACVPVRWARTFASVMYKFMCPAGKECCPWQRHLFMSKLWSGKYVSHDRLCSVWKCFVSRFQLLETEVAESYVREKVLWNYQL